MGQNEEFVVTEADTGQLTQPTGPLSFLMGYGLSERQIRWFQQPPLENRDKPIYVRDRFIPQVVDAARTLLQNGGSVRELLDPLPLPAYTVVWTVVL
jgi:hypothetical protein